MSSLLTFDEYGEAIGNATAVIRDHAKRVALEARVPTCPDWDVRALIAHMGMVHRWATGQLLGEQRDSAALEAEGLATTDLLDWFDQGAAALLQALADTGEVKMARQMTHGTTIHAVDAMTTSLGRAPSPGEVWFRAPVAADGIDHLLTGALSRETSRLRSDAPLSLAVVPDDVDASWTVSVSADAPVVAAGAGPGATTTWRGSAVDLYLALWNRGGAIEETGEPFREQWRELAAVNWG